MVLRQNQFFLPQLEFVRGLCLLPSLQNALLLHRPNAIPRCRALPRHELVMQIEQPLDQQPRNSFLREGTVATRNPSYPSRQEGDERVMAKRMQREPIEERYH